jgi:hypothetical protein
MNHEISVIDSSSAKDVWPQESWGREYLRALCLQGTNGFISNTQSDFAAVQIDGICVPLVINHGAGDRCYLASIQGHYIDYAAAEVALIENKIARASMLALVAALQRLPRLLRLERAVFVNNWLMATNPRVVLDPSQVEALTEYLIRRYSDYAIVFKTIDEVTCPMLLSQLESSGYQRLLSREVYLWDPRAEDRHARREMKLLTTTPYRMVDGTDLEDGEFLRIADLYREVNIERHTALNPQYTPDWFRLIVRSGLMTLKAFCSNGTIDSFCTYFRRGDLIVASAGGHSLALNKTHALYRLANAVCLRAAVESGAVLNMSGGSGVFKRRRGAVPQLEYALVHAEHLSALRRRSWAAFVSLYNGAARQYFGRFEM